METISNNDLAQQAIRKINDNFTELAQGGDSGESDVVVATEQGKPKLFVGSLRNGYPILSGATATFGASNSNVCMNSMVCFPKKNTTYHFKLPDNIGCKLYTAVTLYYQSGTADSSKMELDTTVRQSGVIVNGDDYVIPSNKDYYCVVFIYVDANGDATNVNIAPSKIETLLENGEIEITYDDESPNVIERNVDIERLLFACRRHYVGNVTNLLGDRYWACFGHISDLHGDAARFDNFMRYCDYIEVDGAFNTGDSVMYCHYNGSLFVRDISEKYKSRLSFILGNHEVQINNRGDDDCMADFVSPYIERNGYLESANTSTTHLYWYQDVVKSETDFKINIRVIHVCIYMGGRYVGVNKHDGRYTQAQLNWLINTLKTTPSGYGVVILMHSTEAAITKDNTYGKFYSSQTRYATAHAGSYVDGNRPLRNIIDAFIGRTSEQVEVTEIAENQTDINVTTTYTIDADFTSLSEDSNAPEFICYCTGHYHRDYIGYVDGTTYKQLMLCVASGNALTSNSEEDFPRGTIGAVQDLFNVYVINRDNGVVHVIRAGSNTTSNGEVRDFMSIPYKETNYVSRFAQEMILNPIANETATPSIRAIPNVLYRFNNVVSSINVSLIPPSAEVGKYVFRFKTDGSDLVTPFFNFNGTSVLYPANYVINTNKEYEVTIFYDGRKYLLNYVEYQ